MTNQIQTAIFDIETNGLLPELTRVHILSIRDYERRVTHTFRRNDVEDTIDDGLDLLENADFVVGHNIIAFDIPAIEKVYEGGLNLRGKIRDTLVMSRMCFADQKEKDFRLFEKGTLPGKFIGQHGLKAWGYRLGYEKGDYMDVMEARAAELGITDPAAVSRFVWGTWSQEMEDYCSDGDITITTMLWDRIRRANWSDEATVLEHRIHDLMMEQERNGIHFDEEAAEKLAYELKTEADKLIETTVAHFGRWWAPATKHVVKALWDDPEGVNKKKSYAKPRREFGEDMSRAIWAEVTVPKKTLNFKDPLRASRWEGAPFCAVQLKEFNPASRPQIIDRLATVYKWHPVDFTETGNPEVGDTVLRNLVGHVPMAEELAELFYTTKRLGQVATGAHAWLKKVVVGKIHHYCNTGGTQTGRCSHVNPNLAQVPRVVTGKIEWIDPETGEKLFKKGVLKGRAGRHGWDCRRLFYVPEGWIMSGIDLSGIELRLFGNALAEFDDGEYLEVVLNGDIHTYNQTLWELPTRDHAKTTIYALIYGAGDIKLGSIVAPLADEDEQRIIGARIRELVLARIPAYAKLVKSIHRQAARGYIECLDGRRLFVRSKHSALNMRLQGEGALVAKAWVIGTNDRLDEVFGRRRGWDGDYLPLLFVHDEQQIASREGEVWVEGERVLRNVAIERIAIESSAAVGKRFGLRCPITAAAKSGHNWAETH
jgi:DNA polymerase I-like protein with 3'-5' exonuclease and polymerase domains